jgi:hypothetical protein
VGFAEAPSCGMFIPTCHRLLLGWVVVPIVIV